MGAEKSRAGAGAMKALVLVGEDFEDSEFFYQLRMQLIKAPAILKLLIKMLVFSLSPSMILIANAFGDGGAIPFASGVKVFEPTQRAMIAWNGDEEIMVLSTDLHASLPTKVLEVFPCPSEPTVKKADIQLFTKATAIINEKLAARAKAGMARGFAGGAGSLGRESEPPPARLTFHETIGAQDISVIQVLEPERFVDWVQNYLKSQRVDNPEIPQPLASAVEEYIEDGFSWFAFDVVSLTDQPATKEAIEFRYKTNCLFYPLRISRAQRGDTAITLIILTTHLLDIAQSSAYGIPPKELRLAHSPVDVSSHELSVLNQEMYELLGQPSTAKLRRWNVGGDLSGFKQDLVIFHPSWVLRSRGKDLP